MLGIITQKRCTKCGEKKPLDEFTKDRRKKNGRGSCCSKCKSKSKLDWIHRNPEKNREYQKVFAKGRERRPQQITADKRKEYGLKEYGLTVAEYDEMFRKQNGVCAICKSGNKGRRLCVDHDHKTGRVRGLLCNPCNWALGHMRDDTSLLEKAIEYLKKMFV
jgi:hypothetical protein